MGWSIQEEDSDPAQTGCIVTQNMRTQQRSTSWLHSHLGALFFALVLGTAGAMEAEDTWEAGSGHLAGKDLLQTSTIHCQSMDR